jgi:hypothetical protein
MTLREQEETTMSRLPRDQWVAARAEYEVRADRTLTAIAEQFGVDRAAVSRKAKIEGWQRGKCHGLVERKIALAKENLVVDAETHALGDTHQALVDRVVREQLEEAGAVARLGVAIARKGLEILRNVETPEELEIMARAKRHLTPPPAPSKSGDTTVNVQANAQAAVAAHEPAPLPMPEALESMHRLLREMDTP